MLFLFPSLIYPWQHMLSWLRWEGGVSCQCHLSRICWVSWLAAGAGTTYDTHSLGVLLIVLQWKCPNKKRKHHEEASRHCAGASVCPGLLWVGAAPQGIWRNEALLYCWGRERSWQVLQTFYPSHHLWGWGGHFQGLVGVTVTLTSDCFSFLIRCARSGCGAESPSPESPGGSQLHASV